MKMELIRHQFDRIHLLLDGTVRTGRILNFLYLVRSGLIGVSFLYLSR